jgi:GNAT superfamily N-acetyltransferase
MDASVSLERVSDLPAGLDHLVCASAREDFRFLERLRADWESGANRFSNPGEALLVAHVEHCLVGVCGLNRDPYSSDAGVGRLRRLYVLPEFRRQGIARCLVSRALAAARQHYGSVRIRTEQPVAAKFHEALGFAAALSSRDATHEFPIRG